MNVNGQALATGALDALRSTGGLIADAVSPLVQAASSPLGQAAAWARAKPLSAALGIGISVLVCATAHNAALGQSGPHAAPWFGKGEAVVADAAPKSEAPAQKRARIADPVVFGIQSELTDRGFYSGTIDGLNGSRTRAAISAYEESVGIPPRGEATSALLDRIRLGPVEALPRPDAVTTASTGSDEPLVDLVLQAQRGLVAYGESIATDGVMGPMTRSAIEGFEGAHGMPVTGDASEELLARMKAEGLL